ncbi:hypothetical protein DLAC_00228 [Tieghemostelium lacteum]|uniref:EGF-like domain-containing protein n=1 Tax=Tieghemostelium lacteum TaxID=361077 RepID=A0A152A9G1_TIELA|nr:hypothetical protein DLAC_00228 [Tieghemostelium lacteum]|eukprot:KYR02765.1 hypothetical protein DLAC_00228 [Tieghemostelium lacteum]
MILNLGALPPVSQTQCTIIRNNVNAGCYVPEQSIGDNDELNVRQVMDDYDPAKPWSCSYSMDIMKANARVMVEFTISGVSATNDTVCSTRDCDMSISQEEATSWLNSYPQDSTKPCYYTTPFNGNVYLEKDGLCNYYTYVDGTTGGSGSCQCGDGYSGDACEIAPTNSQSDSSMLVPLFSVIAILAFIASMM